MLRAEKSFTKGFKAGLRAAKSMSFQPGGSMQDVAAAPEEQYVSAQQTRLIHFACPPVQTDICNDCVYGTGSEGKGKRTDAPT